MGSAGIGSQKWAAIGGSARMQRWESSQFGYSERIDPRWDWHVLVAMLLS